jgi:hypothetical protein
LDSNRAFMMGFATATNHERSTATFGINHELRFSDSEWRLLADDGGAT